MGVVVAGFWSMERVLGIRVGWDKVMGEVVRDMTQAVDLVHMEPS